MNRGLNEQHGYVAVYVRLNGIVPPSTDAMNAVRQALSAVRSNLWRLTPEGRAGDGRPPISASDWMDMNLRADVPDYVQQVSPVAVEY